ncbi:uncharacterized protein [Chironomus tepperi]|uniref:uncharacterized protein n=1 Tax=Chironomus tepperi TaxID=113505 RepID=UPI00391F0A8C
MATNNEPNLGKPLKAINSFKRLNVMKMIYGCDNLELSNKSAHDIISSLTILECKNIKKAIDHFSSTDLQHEMQSGHVLLLRIHIEECFDDISQDDLGKLNEICENKSIVLVLKGNDNFSIYWKSKNIQKLLNLKTNNNNYYKNNDRFPEFIINFLSRSLSDGEIGLQKHWLEHSNGYDVDIHLLADSRDLNLLLIAAEFGNAEIVKILLNCGFNTTADDGISAQDLAWKNRHSDVLLVLAQANLLYPDGIDIKQLSNDFKYFYKTTNDLHTAIIDKNEVEVEAILNFHERLEFYFDLSNKSAARVTVDIKAFNIYEIFLIHEVFLAPHEYQQGIFDDLDYDEQRIIRELHNKHSKDLPDKHINILMTHSVISHDVPDAQGKLKYVYNAYKQMSQDPRLNTILKIVAASKETRIIYDFNRDAVNIADPTTSDNTEGVFYTMGRIYIGARQLLDKSTQSQAIGTLAHELCHYAINLKYCNLAMPYKSNDNQTMQEFQEINKNCQKEKGKEAIIDLVYECYPVTMHHAELIVRPAHLIALYQNQPDKLIEISEIFPDLFKFFDRIVNDMENSLKEIEEREKLENEKKDKKISRLRRRFIITMIFGIIMTLLAAVLFFNPEFVQHLARIITGNEFNFNQLNINQVHKIKNALVNYKNIEIRLNDLFLDNSSAYNNLTSDHISMILDDKPLILSDSQFLYINQMIRLDWDNLALKLKQKFLSSNFTFQNESLKFEKLTEISPHLSQDVFKLLTSKNIVDVLDGKVIRVGNVIADKIDYYIERRFVIANDQSLIGTNSQRNQSSKSTEEIIQETLTDKIFILDSQIGSGKTVIFKKITEKIKAKLQYRWVSYIELERMTEILNSYQELQTFSNIPDKILNKSSKQSLGNSEQCSEYYEHSLFSKENKDHDQMIKSLVEFIEKVIGIDPKNEFEKQIFEILFKSGKVIILWDNDRISAENRKMMINVFNLIFQLTGNVQFISSLPLFINQLRKSLNSKIYQPAPFNESEQKEFFRGFFKLQNFSNEKIEIFTQDAFNISKTLQLDSPTMQKFIAQNYECDKLYINPNFYRICEKFVNSTAKTWRNQSITNFDVIQLYQRIAFEKEFQRNLRLKSTNSILESFSRLQILKVKSPKILTIEEIAKMGIVSFRSETDYKFLQPTMADFFFAQYFINNLYYKDAYHYSVESHIPLVYEVFWHILKYYDRSKMVVTFIDHFKMTENIENAEFDDFFKRYRG